MTANIFALHFLAKQQAARSIRTLNGTAHPRHTNCHASEDSSHAFHRLPEQRAIAEALGDVDALLGALEQLIAKKRDLKQAAMQQLLTGHNACRASAASGRLSDELGEFRRISRVTANQVLTSTKASSCNYQSER